MTRIPTEERATLRLAAVLGVAGLLPFGLVVGGLYASSEPALEAWLARALLGYGAVILSFVGAVHWGFALARPSGPRALLLGVGVLPSLLGWAALLLAPRHGMLVQIGALAAFHAYERWLPRGTFPLAYLALRGWLTALVCLALAVGFDLAP